MTRETAVQEPGWPLRTWLLAGLGAGLGLLIQQLVDLPESKWAWGPRLVASAVLFTGISGVAFGLAWQRGRHVPAIIVALVCGAVSGGVLLWNGMPNDDWSLFSWQLFCGLIGSGFILTLFQAAQRRHPHLPATWSPEGLRDWKRKALDYGDVHELIWVDAMLLGASALFMLAVTLIAHLLAEMFWLVKIDVLRELLRKDWVNALMLGAALGGALGLLRDRARIIAALQHVAMLVLRVLAPVLALGLVSFLAVLPFTGLAPLWATGQTTPLMLSAALAALFFTNAVIGERKDEAPVARPLRWGAMALGLVLLPLVAIAAWSTGLRIGQYGFTPDRLWALTFIILGCVTAIAYAVAILRGGDWIGRLYRSNLRLAFILGGVSLLLSTSLVSFERISAADQIARLESGKVKPIDFDYRGLWFDFGPPGKEAIRRLARESKNAEVRKYAASVQKSDSRYGDVLNETEKRQGNDLDKRLTILPATVPLEPKLRATLTDFDVCGREGKCELRYVPGDDYAIATRLPDAGCRGCAPELVLLARSKDGWQTRRASPEEVVSADDPKRSAERQRAEEFKRLEAIRAGKVEIRIIQQRQLFVGGKAFGAPMPMENAAEP